MQEAPSQSQNSAICAAAAQSGIASHYLPPDRCKGDQPRHPIGPGVKPETGRRENLLRSTINVLQGQGFRAVFGSLEIVLEKELHLWLVCNLDCLACSPPL